MVRLAVLEEPRIFPPKKILLVVWGVTLALALYGVIASIDLGVTFLAWVVIALVAFWQIWMLRWVQVDNEGIRMRNVFQRGRELRWDEITEFREEEVRLSKHPYVVIHLTGQGRSGRPRATHITVTNDQIGFETLRTIVREAVPRP